MAWNRNKNFSYEAFFSALISLLCASFRWTPWVLEVLKTRSQNDVNIYARDFSLTQHSYGFQLRSLRKQRQKSLVWLADQAGLNVTYLSRIETGKRPIPAMPIRAAIASALGLTASEIQVLENALAGSYSIFEHVSRVPGQVVVLVMNYADAQLLLGAYKGSVMSLQSE